MAAPVVNSTNVLLNNTETVAEVAGIATEVRNGAVNGSIITDYSVEPQSRGEGYGWDPVNAAIRTRNTGSDLDTELAGVIFDDGNELDQRAPDVGGAMGTVDGSSAIADGKRLFYSHHYTSQGSSLTDTTLVSVGTGYMFGLFSENAPIDRSTDVRLWSGGGRDTIPTLFQPSPTTFIAVDAEHIASEVAIGPATTINTGTNGAFDPTAIISACWVHKAANNNDNFYQTVSRFGYYDAYTLYEGELANPCTFQNLLDTAYSENHFAMAIGGFAQFRPRMAIEFGHRSLGNTQPTFFEVSNISVEFETAIQDTVDSSIRVLHAPFNKIGMEEKLRSGDTWRAVNSTFTSGTPWHLRFNSVLGATVEFNNCILQNAGGIADDCEIGSDVTINGGLIDQFGKLRVNGGTISGASITNPASDAGLAIIPTSNMENLNFSTLDAGKYAIEIPDPAGGTVNYTFDNYKFSNHDFDVRVLGATGTVNISVLNGGDIPVIHVGTETLHTPVLLGTGWVDGSSYTAQAGGGDSLRNVVVVVSNNDSKVPDGVTFGGIAMTRIVDNVQDVIGLSMWQIVETGNTAAFSGAQTIAATWTGGTPTQITFQAATYDHVRQEAQSFETNTRGNSTTGGGVVTALDAPQVVGNLPTTGANFTYAVSAGASRILVVGIGSENGVTIPSAVSYGGQAMTELNQVEDTPGGAGTGGSIWYLLEAGIAAAGTSVCTVTGLTGGATEFSYAVASYTNVSQVTPFSDNGTAIDAAANATGLTINTDDYVFAIHKSTSGGTPSGYTGEVGGTASQGPTTVDGADDPLTFISKIYLGADTLVGAAGVTGGNVRSTWNVAVIASGGVSAGNLDADVVAADEGLVIAAAQFSVVTNIVFDGAVTARDEVDRAGETVAVADYVESAGPATVNAGFSTEDATTGADAQLIVAHIQPAITLSGGPTVNVTANVNVTLSGLRDNTEVRVCAAGDPSIELAGIENAIDGSVDDRSFTFTLQAGTVVDITIFAIDFILPPNNRIESFSIPVSDTTLPITQIQDRVNSNPP